MTVTVRTWRRSALYDVSAATVAGCLAGMNAALVAELAANPTTAKWQVADFSSVNGTLTLKRTANGTGGNGRIMLFGGSSPNTLAADAATLNTTGLYIGYAETATADAPEQAYASGVPYTTGLWIPGGQIISATYTGVNKCEYWEHEDGVCFVFRTANMTSATANLATGFAGYHGVSMDGNTQYAMAWGSASLWLGSQDITLAPSAGLWFPQGTEATATNPRCNYNEIGQGVRQTSRHSVAVSANKRDSMRTSGSRRYMGPILSCNSNQLRITIKLRQIATGIAEVHGQTMSDVNGVQATHLGSRSDAADGGPWLTNFAV